MGLIQRFKNRIDRRFEKHPIVGFVIYGTLTGFIMSMLVIVLLLGLSVLFGIYDRLGINYKVWSSLIGIVVVLAIIVLLYGAMAYFPYKRKGNSFFKKEYIHGNSYKALNSILKEHTGDNNCNNRAIQK